MGVETGRETGAHVSRAEVATRRVDPLRGTEPREAGADGRVPRIVVERPGSHYDQMLRQTRVHHMHLSFLADTKANMLITVSAIAITVLFNLLDNPGLRAPAGMMIAGCVVTCCFAVLSSMPGLLRPRRSRFRRGPLFNPLFFGDFTALSYEEYADEMRSILNEPSLTYEAQVKEIYAIGQYLQNRKYKYLRYAYVALILTVTTSILVWLVGVLAHEGMAPETVGRMLEPGGE